jgi:putative ABC transport system ATP-binding protein
VSTSRLALRNVVRRYPGAGEVVHAVDGVTLEVAAGELVALYGPSGSGKSTLLLLAAGLLPPDAGTITFDGRDVAALSNDEAADYQRHDVGFILQNFGLVPGVPVVENAAIKLLADRVPRKKARQLVTPWLERVGLGDRLEHTPEQLSGGECQRVAIARALANEPGLILADEPTGNLDSRRGADVLELLKSVCTARGAAVLLVTHDPQAAAIADRVCTLRDGKLIATASPPPSGAWIADLTAGMPRS